MRTLKTTFLLLVIPLLAFAAVHKYYVSVTKIEYVKEKESVQIISRIFIDDFEKLLRQRYDKNITLADANELSTIDVYIEKYLSEKLQIQINNKPVLLNFIGKEYEDDIIYCYLEIEGIKEIKSFQISNKILLDIFNEQENIVRIKINNKNKSFLLRKGNEKASFKIN